MCEQEREKKKMSAREQNVKGQENKQSDVTWVCYKLASECDHIWSSQDEICCNTS